MTERLCLAKIKEYKKSLKPMRKVAFIAEIHEPEEDVKNGGLIDVEDLLKELEESEKM